MGDSNEFSYYCSDRKVGKKAGKRKSPCVTQGQLLRAFDNSISQIQYIKGSERIQRKF